MTYLIAQSHSQSLHSRSGGQSGHLGLNIRPIAVKNRLMSQLLPVLGQAVKNRGGLNA